MEKKKNPDHREGLQRVNPAQGEWGNAELLYGGEPVPMIFRLARCLGCGGRILVLWAREWEGGQRCAPCRENFIQKRLMDGEEWKGA